MTKDYGIVKFYHAEKFEDFLRENMKQKFEYLNLDACYEELVEQSDANGNTSYTLSSYETKSGKPEEISFRQACIYENPETGHRFVVDPTDYETPIPDGEDLDECDIIETIYSFV